MAEQEEPIRRRVALKVIKPGMDTKQVIARFEAERVVSVDHTSYPIDGLAFLDEWLLLD